MTAKKCFTYDITRRIYMAYASGQPYSKGRTDQLGSDPNSFNQRAAFARDHGQS